MEQQKQLTSNLDATLAIPTSQLEFVKQIGVGGFGEVYKGTWAHTRVYKATVAIKRLLEKKLDGDVLEAFKNEVSVQVELNSPHIVKIYGITCEQPYCIVMEYMPHGSLYDYLKNTPRESLSWDRRFNMGRDITGGLAYLHGLHPPIIHQDLKSLNVLLDEKYQAKIGDFGLSQVKKASSTSSNASQYKVNSAVGSFLWMAPELFERRAQNTFASDVYALGWTLWELAAHNVPFHEDSAKGSAVIIEYIKDNEREKFPEDTPQDFAQLAQECWTGKPTERPTAAQAFERISRFSGTLTRPANVQHISSHTPQPTYMMVSTGSAFNSQAGASPSYLLNSVAASDTNHSQLSSVQTSTLKPGIPAKPSRLSSGKGSPTAQPSVPPKRLSNNQFTLFSSKPTEESSSETALLTSSMPGEDEYRQGDLYFHCSQNKLALECYLKSAALSYPPAYVRLTRLYGEFLKPKNPQKSQEWLVKVRESLAWFEGQASLESPVAQHCLGLIYMCGLGVTKDLNQSHLWFKKSADKNYAPAQYNLARSFYDGEGTLKDLKEAAVWMLKASNQGIAYASLLLGNLYELGLGVGVNHILTSAYYKTAVRQGCIEAEKDVGRCCENGIGTTIDIPRAIECYKRITTFEDPELCAEGKNYLGMIYYNGKAGKVDYAQALLWLKQSADEGNALGLQNLGICYLKGHGVEKNLITAMQIFEKGANLGAVWCQYRLGEAYLEGEGVKLDVIQGVIWLRKAALQGHTESQEKLGCLHYFNTAANISAQEAFDWFQKAAISGLVLSQFNLGVMYRKGEGVDKNAAESFKWLLAAANQNHLTAQFLVGEAYDNGNGIGQDKGKAMEWYIKAAERGHAQAQYYLAFHYRDRGEGDKFMDWMRKAAEQKYAEAEVKMGVHCKTNEEKFHWYSRAAEHGSSSGQYGLARCYEEGMGVKKNKKLAIAWFEKAAAQNQPDAQRHLDMLAPKTKRSLFGSKK